MYPKTLFVTESESQQAMAQAIQALTSAGLQVVRSFDFQDAHSEHINCPCPHHGKSQCDCQMVVLLVYDQDDPPLTLIVHGHNGRTQFALVDSPAQRPDSHSVANILLQLRPRLRSVSLLNGTPRADGKA